MKLFLAISVNEDAEVHHIDITNAFSNGEIDEEVYIDPPEGLNETKSTFTPNQLQN